MLALSFAARLWFQEVCDGNSLGVVYGIEGWMFSLTFVLWEPTRLLQSASLPLSISHVRSERHCPDVPPSG